MLPPEQFIFNPLQIDLDADDDNLISLTTRSDGSKSDGKNLAYSSIKVLTEEDWAAQRDQITLAENSQERHRMIQRLNDEWFRNNFVPPDDPHEKPYQSTAKAGLPPISSKP